MVHQLLRSLSLKRRSIFFPHLMVFSGDILTVLLSTLTVASQISRTWHLRVEHLVSCWTQLLQDQHCRHRLLMDIYTFLHPQVPLHRGIGGLLSEDCLNQKLTKWPSWRHKLNLALAKHGKNGKTTHQNDTVIII